VLSAKLPALRLLGESAISLRTGWSQVSALALSQRAAPRRPSRAACSRLGQPRGQARWIRWRA
jgi:hypothetical protein